MNVEFVEQLKALSNIDIDTHSGSYELVQQTVRFLSNVENSLIDVDDLEMLFHFGNLKHGKAARDRNIQTSNLLEPDKKAIIELNEKISLGNYTNSGLDDSHQSNGNCGLFAKGRQTLKNVVDKSTAQLFIKMLIQISEMQDSSIDEIFNIVEKYLSKPLKGLGAGIASQILHLLKPNISLFSTVWDRKVIKTK